MSQSEDAESPAPSVEIPSAEDARVKKLLEESRIIIRPDGEVVIENLSELLAELAVELDPDADLTCEVPQDVE